MEGSSIAIKGSAYCFFAFDVADSITLSAIPDQLRPHRVQIAHRHPAPEYVEYADPPVEIALGERQVELDGRTLRANVVARLFDFGAVSISYVLPLPGDLRALPSFAQDLTADVAIETEARRLLVDLVGRVAGCLHRPGLNDLMEDYYVFHVAILQPPRDADSLVREQAGVIAATLAMDASPLSRQQTEELLRDPISYSPADLVLADWNAALVVDDDCDDTLAVLESLNVHLIELRFLDLRLDRALATFSSEVYRHGGILRGMRGPHRAAIRALSELTIETIRLTERIENAPKLIPDVYLARVQRRGGARLGLPGWEESVQSKLDAVRHLITILAERASARRTEALEIAIVLLIMLEIGLALFGWLA